MVSAHEISILLAFREASKHKRIIQKDKNLSSSSSAEWFTIQWGLSQASSQEKDAWTQPLRGEEGKTFSTYLPFHDF